MRRRELLDRRAPRDRPRSAAPPLTTRGDEIAPGGQTPANFWQGEFPWENLMADGRPGTSPVGTYPPNGYGLYDLTGNVWEWTSETIDTSTAHIGFRCVIRA